MANNRKKIDDLFKSELGNYAETPPSAVWDALEKRLDNIPRKPFIPFKWLGYIGLACLLVAIGVVLSRNVFSTNNTETNSIVADNTHTNNGISNGKKESTQATDNTTTDKKNTEANGPIADNNSSTNTTQAQNNNNTIPDKNNDHHTTSDKNIKPKQAATSSDVDQQDGVPGVKKGKKQNGIVSNKHSNKSVASTPGTTPVYASKPGKGHGPDNESEQPQPDQVYNSSTSIVNASTKMNNEVDKEIAPSAPVKTDSVVKKTNPPRNPPPPPPAPKVKFNRFEAGIKGGYELGFDNDASKKAVFSPYVQYRISNKLAIMLQPAIKSASLNGKQIGGATSYYKANDGTLYSKTDSIPAHVVGIPDSFWIWHYTYVQTHDSIVKTNYTGGTYIEFELPILLKYYITKSFAVYGGVNIVYGQQTGITEHTYTVKGLSKASFADGIGPVNAPAPPPTEALNTNFTYTGTPYANYTGPAYPAPNESLLRYGYMLGFNYEYKKLLFDALVQQASVKSALQGGYNISTPLSAPYIRLTIGYKLTK